MIVMYASYVYLRENESQMSKLISGLEKYGLDGKIIESIFSSPNKRTSKRKDSAQQKQEGVPVEEDFLFLKSTMCPICDNVFSTMVVKSGKARRMTPDFDLCPRFEYIDTNKYDVIFCNKCGYAAMSKDFLHISPGQRKLIREGVCKNFKPVEEKISDSAMDYDTAIERHKLALYNSIIKHSRMSEKGYECLKLAWLYRRKAEAIEDGTEIAANKEIAIAFCKKEEMRFYENAYTGLLEAMKSENYPICGMDQNTFDLLLATMSFKLGKLEDAARLVSSLIVSRTVSTNIKNRAQDLKEMIIAEHQKNKK